MKSLFCFMLASSLLLLLAALGRRERTIAHRNRFKSSADAWRDN